jgi:prepilin-type N-terminal cleavage/methylation domain-containing protein
MRKAKLKMQNLALHLVPFARAPRGERGLTLIEVVVTVALVALVLGLVLPRIGITPSLAQSSRHLAGAIQSLSTAAAASNRTYRLHIDLDRQLYWAMLATSDGDRLPSDPSLAFRTALASPTKVEAVTTGRHGKVTAGKVVIEFFPGGRTDQAVIHLSNDDGRMVALVLNPLTGAVHVSDRYDMEPPKALVSETYREFFKALPPPPVLPIQQAQQVQQVQQAQQALQP